MKEITRQGKTTMSLNEVGFYAYEIYLGVKRAQYYILASHGNAEPNWSFVRLATGIADLDFQTGRAALEDFFTNGGRVYQFDNVPEMVNWLAKALKVQ